MERRLGSLRLDVRELDHLGPFLGFVSNQLAKIDWRARERRAAEVGDARLERGIVEAGVDLLVELVDDLGRRLIGRTDAVPLACLVARNELADGRNVRQGVRARCRRHRQRSRNLPALMYPMDAGIGSNNTCTCPPSRSGMASAVPR